MHLIEAHRNRDPQKISFTDLDLSETKCGAPVGFWGDVIQLCNRDLPPAALDARICSFECTFCAECADTRLQGAPTAVVSWCAARCALRPSW